MWINGIVYFLNFTPRWLNVFLVWSRDVQKQTINLYFFFKVKTWFVVSTRKLTSKVSRSVWSCEQCLIPICLCVGILFCTVCTKLSNVFVVFMYAIMSWQEQAFVFASHHYLPSFTPPSWHVPDSSFRRTWCFLHVSFTRPSCVPHASWKTVTMYFMWVMIVTMRIWNNGR